MTARRAQRVAFAATSRLTDFSPVLGARVLDAVLHPAFGSRTLETWLGRRNRRALGRVRAFRRFLAVPDIHIGDAVMTQSALAAVRDHFPDAEIDYVVNRSVGPAIEGHPDASRVLPVFSGAQFPTAGDVEALRTIIRDGDYDLCWSFGSFLDPRDVAPDGPPHVSFLTHAPRLVRNERDPSQVNHFSYQYYRFVRDVLGSVVTPVRPERFPGVRTIYADDVADEAARYAADAGIAAEDPVVMVNPDGACRFTVLPFADQAALLARLVEVAPPATVFLVGSGHSLVGVGQRLVDAVSGPARGRLRIIPRDMPLVVYAALMDRADVFVTGDTGPMHLAASRRFSRSGCRRFRNRTAVLSLFGATVPRMSGYDSQRPGYLAADQDAPSWCYQAGSRCRNLSCLNKYFKTCRTVRCFESVDVHGLAGLVADYLATLRRAEPAA